MAVLCLLSFQGVLKSVTTTERVRAMGTLNISPEERSLKPNADNSKHAALLETVTENATDGNPAHLKSGIFNSNTANVSSTPSHSPMVHESTAFSVPHMDRTGSFAHDVPMAHKFDFECNSVHGRACPTQRSERFPQNPTFHNQQLGCHKDILIALSLLRALTFACSRVGQPRARLQRRVHCS